MSESNRLITVFAEQVRTRFQPDRLESFWDCELLFRKLADPGFVEAVLVAQLKALVADPNHVGDWPPKQIMLHRGAGFALSLAVFDTPRRYIHSTPFLGLYAPIGGRPLVVDRFRLPAGYDNAVFDPSLKLERDAGLTVAPSEVLRLQSQQFAYDFQIGEPQLVLKLTTAPFQMLEWLFSKETLHPWQANDADLSSTQLRVGAYLLGRLAHQSSLAPLQDLAGHANPNVRWAAIQSIGRLSRSEALKRLKVALDDPHPHIRRAAKKSLDHAEQAPRKR